ncbi:MAG: T9SS type A sorting domain-containing protein, partial [Bacteroidetes bacterium]|nr:T9SS type A sorting domain-containing protein [Bacteroidota bacterium]
ALNGLNSGTNYEWQVRTLCTGSNSSWSASALFTTNTATGGGSCDPLSGWISQDIGAASIPGSACDSAGIIKISGSGERIGSTSDEFYFAYQSLPGDGEIYGRIIGFNGTNADAQGGLMIRQSLDEADAFASMMISDDNALDFKRRSVLGGNANATSTGAPLSTWLRLTRIGNKDRGYYSNDGVNGTQLGPAPSVANGTVYIGIVVTNSDNSGLANLEMDNVTVINGSARMLPNTLVDWEVFAYPNPFSSHIILEASEQTAFPVELTLFDLAGQKIDQWIWEERSLKKLAGEDLAKGIYYLRIDSNGETRWIKVMKH